MLKLIDTRKMTLVESEKMAFLKLPMDNFRPIWIKISDQIIKSLHSNFIAFPLDRLLTIKEAMLKIAEYKNVKINENYELITNILKQKVLELQNDKIKPVLDDPQEFRWFIYLLIEIDADLNYWKTYFEENLEIYLFPKNQFSLSKLWHLDLLQQLNVIYRYENQKLDEKVNLLDSWMHFEK